RGRPTQRPGGVVASVLAHQDHAGFDRRWPIVANDDDRARCVLDALPADRAQHESGESAPAAGAEDEGAVGSYGLQKVGCRRAVQSLKGDERWDVAEHLGDHTAEVLDGAIVDLRWRVHFVSAGHGEARATPRLDGP